MNTQTKFTPPPAGFWTVVHNNWDVSSVVDGAGFLITEVAIDVRVDEDTQEQYEADKDCRASFIASAPDLYAALEACADELEAEIQARAIGELPRRISRDMETVERARTALKRARGEG